MNQPRHQLGMNHLPCKNFATPKEPCENFATPKMPCENFARVAKNSQSHFCIAKPMRNLKSLYKLILQPCEFQRSWCEIPTVKEKTKGHSKSLFKDLLSLFSFCTPHSPLRKAQCHLANQFSLQWTPRDHQFEEVTSTSHPILAMARIRGGHTDPSASREAKPRASSPWDSFQAPQALTVPSSEGGCPLALLDSWPLGVSADSCPAGAP